ncbi:MAG TPA: DnaJ domain-containing protein, partial [Roseiflexaceae bacterium]|nr:DnaJ domain-containing protein [Roseiflexaceae bacterium]
MFDFEDLDYYELLGVSRAASTEEIKRAYRREISKYHPDRFARSSPEQQEYAQRRSQRITEAYAVLSDFSARSAYNLGRSPQPRRPSRTTPTGASQPRDHQAELYEQARAHLEAGRAVQAAGVLRQLQQINPFYRDSA